MNWTSDQHKAIVQNGSDILVSAAAGSGKTAVLVERIIRKILDSEDPMDIDRMLVVTFTEAAAAEMKEKIIRALQNDGSVRANKQLRLAGSADITTIDAFCLRCVKNNFHNIGIDPDFGICDKSESVLLKEECAEALFDDLYKSENAKEKERFLRLTQMYSSNRNDYDLRDYVLKIYQFIQTFPEPEKWLDEKAAMYAVSGDEVFETVWVKDVIGRIKETGEEYYGTFKDLLCEITDIFGGDDEHDVNSVQFPYSGIENESTWKKQWESVKLAIDASGMVKEIFADEMPTKEVWDKAYAVIGQACDDTYFPSRKIQGKAKEDEDLVSFNEKRKRLSSEFKSRLENSINISAADFMEQSKTLKQAADDIVWLVKKFGELYMSVKEKRGIFEFSDIEHMTYNLFQNKEIQEEYRNKYDEILIDEYQDTNGLQDSIFNSISKNNIFMVGDLKQSIYRFRGGDPFIFKSKSNRYQNGDEGVRIALSQNFRSRMEILDSVNSVFSCVMSDAVGDVVYEGDEMLSRENDYYTENGSDHKSEMHLIAVMKDSEDDELSEMTDTAIEAAHVAGEIRRMIDEKYQVMCGMDDDGNPVYRDICARDITILATSVRYIGDIYTEELAKQGIRAYIESEGYFQKKEIMLMLSLLRLIDNNRHDIPLVAVMRSPIGGFDDEELARIRLSNRHTECFYDAVKLYEKEDNALGIKCREFIKSVDRWGGYTHYRSVAGLLWSLYEETGLYDFMGALEGGEEAQANLRLLYERAKQYEEAGFKGLFNFIKYIEHISERSEDIGTAKIIGENHDVVRIMTIHKSKGLEFPVVFLVSAGKRMQKSGGNDDEKYINLHKDAGLGMMYINADESYYSETIQHKYVAKLNLAEKQSENMRRLYVALTRPKEKLIVTAVVKFKDENVFANALDMWKNKAAGGKMDEVDSLYANRFCDWIIPAVFANPEKWEFKTERAHSLYASDIFDILEYKYPYESCCLLPSKTTVSDIKQLKHKAIGSADYSMTKKPHFAEDAQEANVIGTAHHQIMAYINIKPDMDEGYISSEVRRICLDGQISEDDEKNISIKFIKEFFDGDLGRRMASAAEEGKLMREAPFEIAIGTDIYEDVVDKDSLCGDDEIIIQGAIDCFFEEEDGIVLIDYKTDRFGGNLEDSGEVEKFIDEKTQDYAIQLELYKTAIEKITHKRVKEKYLYLFSVERMAEV